MLGRGQSYSEFIVATCNKWSSSIGDVGCIRDSEPWCNSGKKQTCTIMKVRF